jgi:hypothetical protein
MRRYYVVLRFEEQYLPDVVYVDQLTAPCTWNSVRMSSTIWASWNGLAARH